MPTRSPEEEAAAVAEGVEVVAGVAPVAAGEAVVMADAEDPSEAGVAAQVCSDSSIRIYSLDFEC